MLVAMKAEMLLSVLLVVSLGSRPGDAWGGLFNRFSPEMLSNLGYGGHGYGSYRSQPLLQVLRVWLDRYKRSLKLHNVL
uniref:Uncharacterized protein n=1 Tax=Timema shepardi TaxID=629360 RepID=A0A7R9B3B4_TIMSH|nr:unnamed protein product [Timema shepardi]